MLADVQQTVVLFKALYLVLRPLSIVMFYG